MMERKPLIVMSICAVVLLILGSLSTAVGYQVETPLIQKEMTHSSNQGCDCEDAAGITSWPFPLLCGILGALGVLLILLVTNTNIGNNMLIMILYLYDVFQCG
jgi:hypothetical protein